MKRMEYLSFALCVSICWPAAATEASGVGDGAPSSAIVSAANRAATSAPKPDRFLNAVQVYPYSVGTIYKLITAPEHVTDIALQPGEDLIAVASGDTVRWIIGDTASGDGATKQVHVLVKPSMAGLSTNVLITTDRRAYHLSLVSTARSALTGISWSYPQDALLALRRAGEAAKALEPVSAGIAIEQLHFNYEITGDRPTWRPIRAFDDGRQTYVEFPASIAVGDAPPLFLVDRKGEAQLVNYRLKGRFYVVDRIFDRAELRFGTKKQQVVRISRVAEPKRGRRS